MTDEQWVSGGVVPKGPRVRFVVDSGSSRSARLAFQEEERRRWEQCADLIAALRPGSFDGFIISVTRDGIEAAADVLAETEDPA